MDLRLRDDLILGSARASRADFGAWPKSSRNSRRIGGLSEEFAIARAQSPAREARALPGTIHRPYHANAP